MASARAALGVAALLVLLGVATAQLPGQESLVLPQQEGVQVDVFGLQLQSKPQSLEEWRQEAALNATMFKNSLLLKTMLVTKELHRARVQALQQGILGPDTAKSAHHAERPYGHLMFQLANPYVTCPPLASSLPGTVSKLGGINMRRGEVAATDGHKFICNIEGLKPGCSFLSIGSRGDTSFERDVLEKTPCDVITLDCTLKKLLEPLHPTRHKFFPLCLGSPERAAVDPKFITLPQLMQKVGKERVEYLKMDIEAYEWDVLASLGTEPGYEKSLPVQMAVELHVGSPYYGSPSYRKSTDWNNLLWPMHLPTFSQLQLLITHVANLGYGITSRDDNPLSKGCTELLFHLIEK